MKPKVQGELAGEGHFQETESQCVREQTGRTSKPPQGAMASSYAEDLTCPICLTIFSDPVTLHCGHSFCRECITLSLSLQQQCPQCRTSVPERTALTTNHILKSLSEKTKENKNQDKVSGKDKEAAGGFCPEHEEKLKLFCITDQQLACIICRDGEKHEGHKFKPVREAAASLRKELETFVLNVSNDNLAAEKVATTQKEEMAKSREKSQQLMAQISSQFEEMHQILRQKEEEIKKELKLKENEEMKKMSENLNAAERVLSEGKELDQKVKSVLEITDFERFLRSWTEGSGETAQHSFKPRAGNLGVVKASLSLGRSENPRKFFVWKEDLQVTPPQNEPVIFISPVSASAASDNWRRPSSAQQRGPLRGNNSSLHARLAAMQRNHYYLGSPHQ